jgi:hypothetical protein
VRVGGWPNTINRYPHNAMTFDGSVHLRTEEDYNFYMDPANKWWSNHECRHLQQETLFPTTLSFFLSVAATYVVPGYEDSPFEIDARNHEGRGQ